MISVWGVEHGDEVSKGMFENKKSSGGRKVLGTLAPGLHAPIAGKKGKKLRATGNQWGGSLAGGLGGRAVGALATRGSTAGQTIGGVGGAGAGALAGLARNERKGYLKNQV